MTKVKLKGLLWKHVCSSLPIAKSLKSFSRQNPKRTWQSLNSYLNLQVSLELSTKLLCAIWYTYRSLSFLKFSNKSDSAFPSIFFWQRHIGDDRPRLTSWRGRRQFQMRCNWNFSWIWIKTNNQSVANTSQFWVWFCLFCARFQRDCLIFKRPLHLLVFETKF